MAGAAPWGHQRLAAVRSTLTLARPAPRPPSPLPCAQSGRCPRGDNCPYAHSVFELHLHPNRYRTQLCTMGASCRRPDSFFAHTQ